MRTIPIALQAHYDQDATTTCFLLRVECVGRFAGTVLCFASLDATVTYDDGDGEYPYLADNGFAPERLQASADLDVDNTDLSGWVSDSGVTEQQIRAGIFDFARVKLYRVNYMDLSQGHELVGSGTCGETKFGASSWKTEFRSLIQQLKQPHSTLYSLTCRAQFGDSRCGKAFTWVSGTVTAVDVAEPDRIFTDTSNAQADDHYRLGVVEWLTGDNAGAQMEVDTNTSDVFDLSLPLAYPVQVGDTYRVRQDCDKSLAMCRDTHNNVVNMRAEPYIPIADGGASQVPGAQVA